MFRLTQGDHFFFYWTLKRLLHSNWNLARLPDPKSSKNRGKLVEVSLTNLFNTAKVDKLIRPY